MAKQASQRYLDLQKRIRALSDRELVEMLEDDPLSWTPDSLSIARAEAEARGGLRFLREGLNNGQSQPHDRFSAGEQRDYAQNPTISFACTTCEGGLRLREIRMDAIYRCPKCKTQFKAVQANNLPLVFLLLPQAGRSSRESSDNLSRDRRRITPEVRAALAVFDLDTEVTFDHVRLAYRQLVKSYHPDMVAHLGPDLRKLAEAKTKEINSAFAILERFYGA